MIKHTLGFVSTLLLVAALSCTASAGRRTRPSPHPFFAASCVFLSKSCSTFFQDLSDGCLKETRYDKQPRECYRSFCPWCKAWEHRWVKFPCGTKNVREMCKIPGPGYNGSPPPMFSPTSSPSVSMEPSPSKKPRSYWKPKPSPSKSPKPSRKPKPSPSKSSAPEAAAPPAPVPEQDKGDDSKVEEGCVWTGKEGEEYVVVNVGAVPEGKGWRKVKRDGMIGQQFYWSPHQGPISPSGMYGVMCFDVRPPVSGKYYFTGITYAPHKTEHNDMWVESGLGFELWKFPTKHGYIRSGKYIKAYQSNGEVEGMADFLHTIDFNAHKFLIPNVEKGRKFQVCIAGRSLLFEVYRLVMHKCDGSSCVGRRMPGMMDLKPSKCV